ncbi:MAG: RNA pseudouridine synthase [Betaproteobacteria bacterium RBG_16_64_9]|nr:MAG: RNA pseudouridine synthase [Betaproteobacteria bacterium RBG_16_64_9]OGA27990.1 MAG: RNA pseudouridine synthase [Betaproteobacteria bacterium RIFCSPLOWO2_02_FULL_65_24]OGA95741.1 MAG: RNA pseudouridine synthase [Betaproteobacteria bacterium RIFCSPLOWO2_12_FULL_66_14]
MKDLSNISSSAAVSAVVEAESDRQRIDNFLLRHCKGVPRSHIYRILRTGEVRVNSRRVDATYRVREGDRVRIPPIRVAGRGTGKLPAPAVELPVLLEDDWLLAVDKPAGMAVHGGSGVSFGVIERMRSARPELKRLELVHRLDRETSGVLLLAKKRVALLALHAALREGRAEKSYIALVKGKWRGEERRIDLPLRKYLTSAGERRVSVDAQGRASITVFRPLRQGRSCTLLSADLHTGRTHQIRVHLAHLGYPIAGDDKYGDFDWNRELSRQGLKRMFLHAAQMSFDHPVTGARLTVVSPLPAELKRVVTELTEA